MFRPYGYFTNKCVNSSYQFCANNDIIANQGGGIWFKLEQQQFLNNGLMI